MRRPRRAVQRTSTTAIGAAGSRYFGPSQGSDGEQRGADERAAERRPLAHPQRAQRGARERRPRRGLGVDGGRVRQRGRGEPDDQRRAARPRLRHDPARDRRGEHEAERRDRRQEELDRVRPAERVGRRDQQREADALRLDAAAEDHPALRGAACRRGSPRRRASANSSVRSMSRSRDDRLGDQEVARLVAAVVALPDRVDPERRRVGGEEDRPEGQRAHPLHVAGAPPRSAASAARVRRRAPGRSPSAGPRRCPRRW